MGRIHYSDQLPIEGDIIVSTETTIGYDSGGYEIYTIKFESGKEISITYQSRRKSTDKVEPGILQSCINQTDNE